MDLIVCWRRIGGERELFVLVSTLVAGVQEVLGAWRHRWDLECLHRLYKQNLGLGACQARAFSSQVRWVDLVVEAALLVGAERLVSPGLAWRVAQARAAVRFEKAVLTGGWRVGVIGGCVGRTLDYRFRLLRLAREFLPQSAGTASGLDLA